MEDKKSKDRVKRMRKEMRKERNNEKDKEMNTKKIDKEKYNREERE